MENKDFCRKNVIKEYEERIEMHEKSKIDLNNEVNSLNKKINNHKTLTNILNAVIMVCIYLANKKISSTVSINLINIYNLIVLGSCSILIVNTYKYFKDTKDMRNKKREKLEEISYLNDEIKYLRYTNYNIEKEIEKDECFLHNNENKVKKLIHRKKK